MPCRYLASAGTPVNDNNNYYLYVAGGILKNPYQTVLPAAAFPYPSIEQLRPMTVFDVHCGRYRDMTFWDWVKNNMPNVLSIIPH